MPAATISRGPGRTPLGPTETLATSHAITFLAADPPRLGAFVVYDRSPGPPVDAGRFPEEVEVILPNASGKGVRRPVADAVSLLHDLDADVAGAAAWSEALDVGLG